MDKLFTFNDRRAFREWLGKYGQESDGIWLLLSKNSNIVTLSAMEALEEALCHGWIDGQILSLDANTYKKYFSRRRARSRWSARNKELAEILIKKGLMTRQGLDAVESARKNGSWDSAERSVIDDEQIKIFKEVIRPYEPAYSNLMEMSHSVQRTYTGFYLEAKSDQTRKLRLERIIDRLNRNLKPM